MEFKLVKKDEIKLIGLKDRIDLKTNQIPVLWGNLLDRKHEIKNLVSTACFGVAENFDFNPELSFLDETVAFEVKDFSDVPKGMITKIIKPHLYMVFTHKGPIYGTETSPGLEKTYEAIYLDAIPKSGYRVNPEFNFEYYDERFNHNDLSSEFDIYIPILEKKSEEDED